MLKSLRSLYRRDPSVRELRQLDRTLLDDIGLERVGKPLATGSDALLLIHHGPFQR